MVDEQERRIEQSWEQKQRYRLNSWWGSRADTNKDGKIDSKEMAAWKKLKKERLDLNGDGRITPEEVRLSWQHTRSDVNTPLEAKYDKNNDGWLQPQEAKEFLKNRLTLIKTLDKTMVESLIEKEYDINEDGFIDHQEAKILEKDLK